MSRRKFFSCIVIVACVFLISSITGCTIIFQKGRRSDLEKIQNLEEEVNRLSELKSVLERELSGIKDVGLSMQERGLVITFLDKVLFDSGKAAIKPQGTSVLKKVADVVTSKASDLNIGIEGHTDNVPIKYSRWKSNWELSTARAISVLHYLEENGVSPHKLAAIGYGEYRPVSSNDTKEGRQTNRRVEIVILPEIQKSYKAPVNVRPIK